MKDLITSETEKQSHKLIIWMIDGMELSIQL